MSTTISETPTEESIIQDSENLNVTQETKSTIDESEDIALTKIKKNFESLSTSANSIVTKQIHPDLDLVEKSFKLLNSIQYDIFIRLLKEGFRLANMNESNTLTTQEIQNAVQLLLPGDLALHAISEGSRAIAKININEDKDKSRSSRAGLQYSVARIQRIIRDYCNIGHYAEHISGNTAVYVATVLEYLAVEILELGGNAARDNKKDKVFPNHIMMAILNDEELNALINIDNYREKFS